MVPLRRDLSVPAARHLQDVNVASDIGEVLASSGLDAAALVVEVTETALIGDVDSASVVLARFAQSELTAHPAAERS